MIEFFDYLPPGWHKHLVEGLFVWTVLMTTLLAGSSVYHWIKEKMSK